MYILVCNSCSTLVGETKVGIGGQLDEGSCFVCLLIYSAYERALRYNSTALDVESREFYLQFKAVL